MMDPIPSFIMILFVVLFVPVVFASSSSSSHAGYVYYGCYNETTNIANSTGVRALGGGTNEVGQGTMTVQACHDFCSAGGAAYRFAGLEYSRECWCSQYLSGLSAKFPDSACDLPCDGNSSEICGGSLKLSVYEHSAASARGTLTGAALVVVVGAVMVNMCQW